MRKSSRGNPWHDSRGRFCSGPKADGVMSPNEIEKVDMKPGDSVRIKGGNGDMYFFAESSPGASNEKIQYSQTLSVGDGTVEVTTNTEVNGRKYTDVDRFNMSYDEFKEFSRLTARKNDANGEVCQEFDADRIVIYSNSDSAFLEEFRSVENEDGSLEPCTTELRFKDGGIDVNVYADESGEHIYKARLEKDADGIWSTEKLNMLSFGTDRRRRECTDEDTVRFFRTLELCGKWE